MTLSIQKHNVLGVLVAEVDLTSAVRLTIDAARRRRPFGVSAVAVHGVMEAVQDPQLRYCINHLEMVVPDGQPVRWALNWLYDCDLEDRVFGPDLMFEVCRAAAVNDQSVFFYGSTARTLERMSRRISEAVPDLHVAGLQPSRFRSATTYERNQDLLRIVESGASIVFVGLGCPRQEIFTYENREELSMPVLAVGAAFDYHAGQLKRAPRWVGKAGMEWLYRLAQEPSRLAGRYLKLNPQFVARLAGQRMGFRRFTHEFDEPPPHPLRPS